MEASSARPTASRTSATVRRSGAKASTWSSSDSASRMPPSASRAMSASASSSASAASAAQMRASLPTIVASARGRKSWRWVRLMIVGSTLCVSVVARMKTTWSGGSSMSFRSALKACVLSICTSSMM
jgi:hypothetical protein